MLEAILQLTWDGWIAFGVLLFCAFWVGAIVSSPFVERLVCPGNPYPLSYKWMWLAVVWAFPAMFAGDYLYEVARFHTLLLPLAGFVIGVLVTWLEEVRCSRPGRSERRAG